MTNRNPNPGGLPPPPPPVPVEYIDHIKQVNGENSQRHVSGEHSRSGAGDSSPPKWQEPPAKNGRPGLDAKSQLLHLLGSEGEALLDNYSFTSEVLRVVARERAAKYVSGGGEEWPEIDLAEVFESGIEVPDPNVLFRVDGKALLYSGLANCIFGDAGAGKTAFCQAAVAEEIRQRRHAYVVDYEVNVMVWLTRLLALGLERAEITEFFHYLDTAQGTRPPGAVRDGSSLMVLDSLTAALESFGQEMNDAAGIEAIYRQVVDPFTDQGLAALVIDHVGHADKTRPMNSIRKTGKVQGAMFRMAGVVGQPFGRGRTGAAVLTVHKDNMGGLDAPKGAVAARFTMASSNGGSRIECQLTSDGGLDLKALSEAVEAERSGERLYRAVVLKVATDPGYVPLSQRALATRCAEVAAENDGTASPKTFQRTIKAMLVDGDAGIEISRAKVVAS